MAQAGRIPSGPQCGTNVKAGTNVRAPRQAINHVHLTDKRTNGTEVRLTTKLMRRSKRMTIEISPLLVRCVSAGRATEPPCE